MMRLTEYIRFRVSMKPIKRLRLAQYFKANIHKTDKDVN
jgi:hypothetical protein